MTIQPIAVTRAQAAEMLGVSPDLIKQAQNAGALKAKNTVIDAKTGRAVGKTLYSVEALREWFDSLPDA